MKTSEALTFFDQFFRSAPAAIDVEAIRRQWLALPPTYCVDDRRLPLPIWARRGLTDDGEEAWRTLRREVGRVPVTRPFCVYVHVPFCASRCAFCDCYAFPLRRHRDERSERYLDLLGQEVRLWGQLESLPHRPVSTVHLGGGTPTFLPHHALARLVQDLREHFSPDPRTEWALESTSSELDPGMMSTLSELGFTRLHVGVQSLEDGVRHIIGRREPATAVLEKIARAVDAGWIVSVDLILGLPQQTLDGVVDDITALEAMGVDGFSLYELQRSSRNRRFIREHGLADQGRLTAYFLTQTASRLLTALGYRKTLFNHFARDRDTNLYFTFPERGEDCLALGTTADGVFGDYHYRHPAYKVYRQKVSPAFPGLQGGLRRSALESRLFPLEVALLSGSIYPAPFKDVLGREHAERLLHRWREATLVENQPATPALRLTANGSWFISTMMADLTA